MTVVKSVRVAEVVDHRVKAAIADTSAGSTALRKPMKESEAIQVALDAGSAEVVRRTASWSWLCDQCFQPIPSARDGIAEWVELESSSTQRDLRIVHKGGRRFARCEMNEPAEAAKDGGVVRRCDLADLLGVDGFMR